MKELKMYQVDAFTDQVFGGNPAAVCVLENAIDEIIMQRIAMENNLSETAFLVKNKDDFDIRWFTPLSEVALCGHATLASAFVLFELLGYSKDRLHFHSRESGILSVTRNGDIFTLDFPVDPPQQIDVNPQLEQALGLEIKEQYSGKTDLMAVLHRQEQVATMKPDFRKLLSFEKRGFIVTAPGDNCDFVSRFFCPALGIDEDPVTGSAHTTMAPYWATKLNKSKMDAKQLSKRGGNLTVQLDGERVLISGKAVLYMEGIIKV